MITKFRLAVGAVVLSLFAAACQPAPPPGYEYRYGRGLCKIGTQLCERP